MGQVTWAQILALHNLLHHSQVFLCMELRMPSLMNLTEIRLSPVVQGRGFVGLASPSLEGGSEQVGLLPFQ